MNLDSIQSWWFVKWDKFMESAQRPAEHAWLPIASEFLEMGLQVAKGL